MFVRCFAYTPVTVALKRTKVAFASCLYSPARSIWTLPQAFRRLIVTDAVAEGASSKQPLSQKVRFVDKVRLTVQGGTGGNGCVAYAATGRGRHLKADGGHGGRGGDVTLVATKHLLSLAGVHQFCAAKNGGHGGSQSRNGANGAAHLVEVPVGTVVKRLPNSEQDEPDLDTPDIGEEYDERGLPLWMSQPNKPTFGLLDDDEADEAAGRSQQRDASPAAKDASKGSSRASGSSTGSSSRSAPRAAAAPATSGPAGEETAREAATRKLQRRAQQEEQAEVLGTLIADGQQMVVAQGGPGGLGNVAFRSKPYGPPSDRSEEGQGGQRVRLLLESRLIADVGLVGLPNAGKSTLLAALTGARAQIGHYEFTTLRPQLGALMCPGGSRLTVADIPGLLEGAARGTGRGNEFLRHIERTRCLLYVVDVTGGEGGLVRLPAHQQLRVLQQELRLYRPELLKVPAMVAANKVDRLPGGRGVEALEELQQSTPLPVVPLSAQRGSGLDLLREALQQLAPPQLPS